MSKIKVLPMSEHEFGVQVTEADEHTDHRVTVGDRLLDDLGLIDVDLGALVHESFAFLLERRKPVEIPAQLNLAELRRDYEEYLPEMRTRLG